LKNATKRIRRGDLVLISTPEFHVKRLGEDLEGKSGVVTHVSEMGISVVPFDTGRPMKESYEVLVEGRFIMFYDDKYLSKISRS